jgi:hypothetical protein
MADNRGTEVYNNNQVPTLRSIPEVDAMLHNGTSFDANLYRLMQKADTSNWIILRKAFPVQAHEFTRWLHQGWDPK